ncbi:MAG TPA: hypothetical protein VGJ66_07015 [Pyrinomonadaceae bacterium]|jgi:hypothetical protein
MIKFLYKWLIATVAGAVTFFVWGAFSHLMLLKGVGFNRVSDEARIVSALRTSLPGDGLYFVPSIDLRGSPSKEETAAWEARFRAGPTGMIVYHAAGDAPVSPRKLSVQFLSDLLAAGVLSYVLSLTIAAYWRRVALAGLLGAFGLFAISTIYWNWYGFPNAFFLAQGVDMVVGWSLAGAVIAKLIPSARS